MLLIDLEGNETGRQNNFRIVIILQNLIAK